MNQIETASIPFRLASLNQWVVWRLDDSQKVPYQLTGERAKSNDRSTWCSFEDAVEEFNRGGWAGIGFMFSADDPFCGIDLDGCRNPVTGETADWAKSWLRKFGSYAEVSPSQTGWKVWVSATNPRDSGKNRKVDEPAVSDKDPGVEIYDQKRWFAVTGFGDGEIDRAQDAVEKFCNLYWPQGDPDWSEFLDSANAVTTDAVSRASKYVAKMPPAVSGSGGHNMAFRVACVLVLGFQMSLEDAYRVFAEWNQTCQPPWNDREIRHKLSDANKQEGPRGMLLNREVAWDKVSFPKMPESHVDDSETIETAALRYLESLESGEELVSLGISAVDEALAGGVVFGEMVIVAARPSHGKSAFALQTLDHAAESGLPGLMVSEEMSRLAIGKRALQFLSDIPEHRWNANADAVRDSVGAHYAARKPILVVESLRTVDAIEESIEHHINEYGVRIVAVDYAQLLQGDGRSRYEQVSSVSVGLRRAASRFNIVLIVLCQLSREIEKRDRFVPKMTDLRESGQLEQDADVILFLAWPHRINDQEPRERFQVFCAKNRNRAIYRSAVECEFDPSRQRITGARPDNYVDGFDAWNEGAES